MNRSVAIIGAGQAGAGWVVRFLLAGWKVRIFDTDPRAGERVESVLHDTEKRLSDGNLTFHETLSETVRGVGWIQESLPERLLLKRKVFQKIQEFCERDAVIASSTAGFSLSEIQGCATWPGQIVIMRPEDPAFRLQSVEFLSNGNNPSHLVAQVNTVLDQLRLGCKATAPPIIR